MPSAPRFVFSASGILLPSGLHERPSSVGDGSAFMQSVTMEAAPAEYLKLPGGQVLAERHADGSPAPLGFEWVGFRIVINTYSEGAWTQAAKALALLNWRASTRFCGKCGAENGDKPDEIARLCPNCGALGFPRLSPAVVVAIIKDGKLLLARNALSKLGFFSLIAGFVEPGETFEECARREVMEEVGLVVDTIQYAGSQPWPFPDQLMVAFTARWAGGEVKPDGVEIAEAAWFSPSSPPSLPNSGSLSRRIIDRVLEGLAEGS